MLKCPGCGEENPDKFRLCGYCGTRLVAVAALPAREVRKTVTIVFSDLKGSTALGERLDPEAFHEVKDRYFDAMAAEITRHGGKIEKYIGDAIMAVFGLPRAHEDDALRAVRAAAGMQAALARLNEDLRRRYGIALANRTGVNTGEVVANDDPSADQKLATGDAVNVAARLEQAAPENQIYLGEITWRLVRDAVEAEAVEPLELKGKARAVAAHRLVSIRTLDRRRRLETPIVGRDAELEALGESYREAAQRRSARLVTLIGDAGVGKTRLVQEFVDRVAAEARVLRGRCLPYGDGITFWPLRQIVAEAAGIANDDPPELARSKLLATAGQADVAERVASVAGLSAAPFPLAELNWAVRRFLETLASETPLAVLVDDIHWAEPAFLDLLEHLLDASKDAPILLLAAARHELLEEHPQWGEQPAALRLVLRPLDAAASRQVAQHLIGSSGLPEDVLGRIVRASEGNPLYVEQMLSMLVESRVLRLEGARWVRDETAGEIAVPPTIQALLEARLDRLARGERATVEPASVIGLEFPQPAVEVLAPEAARAAIGEHMSSLARKRFIQPTPLSRTESIYRFHHQLVRDTVYNGLLKRARATLHIDFVAWADRINAERERDLEFQEILGYHLEQAHRYLSELGPLDEKGLSIGADAARRLGAAGKRAFARSDLRAAVTLLRRAAALLAPEAQGRFALLPELGEALMELGEFAEARTVLDAACAAPDPQLKATAQALRMLVRLYSAEPGEWSERALGVAHEVIARFESQPAHDALAAAWRLVAVVQGVAGRYREANVAVARALAEARSAGNNRLVARSAVALANGDLLGPTPALQAIAACERILADGLGERQVEAIVLCRLACLRAMNGQFEQARSLYRRGRKLLADLGTSVIAASMSIELAQLELLAGDLAAAEREIRPDYEFLSRTGETYFLSTMAAMLARIVRDQGRDAEALALCSAAAAAAAEHDVDAQAQWRAVRAPILARAGRIAEAEAMARDALLLVRRTENPILQGDALIALAEVLVEARRAEEARASANEAIALFESKGNVVAAQRSARWLEHVA